MLRFARDAVGLADISALSAPASARCAPKVKECLKYCNEAARAILSGSLSSG